MAKSIFSEIADHHFEWVTSYQDAFGGGQLAKNKALDDFVGRGKERPGRAGTEQIVVEGMEGVEGFTGKEYDF